MGQQHSGHPLSNAATASNVRVTNSRIYKALFTPVTTVAEFGEGRRFQQQSPNSATNCRRFRQLHPVWTGLKDVFGGKR